MTIMPGSFAHRPPKLRDAATDEKMFIQGKKCATILGGFPAIRTIFVIER
jgi:hypothetical protein